MLYISHRGDTASAPENTLKAFRSAIDNGFKAIECDVYLTRDGAPVILHDAMLEKRTNGRGYVGDSSLTDIRALDAGQGQQIPTLSEVIELVVRRAKCRLIIEIKAGDEAGAEATAEVVAGMVLALSPFDRRRIEIHSFWYHALCRIRNALPRVPMAVIILGGFSGAEMVEVARKAGANGVSIGFEYINPEAVEACRNKGLFVDSWSDGDPTTYRRLEGLGIQAIIGTISRRSGI